MAGLAGVLAAYGIVQRDARVETFIPDGTTGGINVKSHGAVGDGVTDDTAALLAAFAALNEQGSGELYFPPGTYLHGLLDFADFPESRWKRSLAGAMADMRRFNPNVKLTPIGLPLVGLRGARITGDARAVIKRKDGSATTDTNGVFSWAQMFLFDCQDVEIHGFAMDANRAGQVHTRAFVTGTANYNIYLVPALISGAMVEVRNIDIHDMAFTGAGTLQTSPSDKQGDCIYMRNGFKQVEIHRNRFEDWSRWAITVEAGWPRDAGGYDPGDNLSIHDNVFRVGFKQDGAVHLGAIDIEGWEPTHNVSIERNRFYGSCKISFISAPFPTLHQVLHGFTVVGNVWDMRGQVSSTGPNDVIVGMIGDWGKITASSVERSRRHVDVNISDNLLLNQVEYNQFVQASECILDGATIRNNRANVSSGALTHDAMIRFQSVSLRGDIRIEDNYSNIKVKLIDIASFQNDFENKDFTLHITGNSALRSSAAIRYTGPAYLIGGAGTVSTTPGSATITGTRTAFRTELRAGGKIRVTNTGEMLTIARIDSQTSATATGNAANTEASSAFTRTPGVVYINGNKVPAQLAATGTIITANQSLVIWGRRNSIAGVVTLNGVATPATASPAKIE